jgi:hypothetical protein
MRWICLLGFNDGGLEALQYDFSFAAKNQEMNKTHLERCYRYMRDISEKLLLCVLIVISLSYKPKPNQIHFPPKEKKRNALSSLTRIR